MAQLLPNGNQQFIDANGNPLVGGLVYFYIPNTTTLKDTYQDSAQTILNTNPVVLDSRGQATIFGSGDYRQILKDSLGNSIWDKTVSSFSSAADVQAGVASFSVDTSVTANTVTAPLSPVPAALSDGMLVRVKIKTANTGPTTLNGVPVLGLGGAPLRGRELAANSRAIFMYSATAASWILLGCENVAFLPGQLIQQVSFFDAGSSTTSLGAVSLQGTEFTFTPKSTNSLIRVAYAFELDMPAKATSDLASKLQIVASSPAANLSPVINATTQAPSGGTGYSTPSSIISDPKANASLSNWVFALNGWVTVSGSSIGALSIRAVVTETQA